MKLPFRLGDVVCKKNSDEEMIIHEVIFSSESSFEYSTNHGAWYPHNSLKLIRLCNKESLKQLFSDLTDEGIIDT